MRDSKTHLGKNLIRPIIQKLHPYVPGEQPKVKGLIKLNTNENPYPPSPKVLAAVKRATDGRLRLYPNPTAQKLREALARFHGCKKENVIVGNGSDELLAMAVRCFVEPKRQGNGVESPPSPLARLPRGEGNQSGACHGDERGGVRGKDVAQFFTPSYSLYPVLAETHGAAINRVALKADFDLPSVRELRREGKWDWRAALTLITTP